MIGFALWKTPALHYQVLFEEIVDAMIVDVIEVFHERVELLLSLFDVQSVVQVLDHYFPIVVRTTSALHIQAVLLD